MSGHNWNTDSPESGEPVRAVEPTEPVAQSSGYEVAPEPIDEIAAAPKAAKKSLFRAMPQNLAGFSMSQFRQRIKIKSSEQASVDETAPIPLDGEQPPAKSNAVFRLVGKAALSARDIDWQKVPLANAPRQTRFGVAALLSFVVLVSVLLVNHNATRNKDSKSTALLAVNPPTGDPKNSAPSKKSTRKNRIAPEPPGATPGGDDGRLLASAEEVRRTSIDTPPMPAEPPKNEPPKSEPPKTEPPKIEEPPKSGPDAPPKVEPTEPPKSEPPKNEPSPLPKPEPTPPKVEPTPIPKPDEPKAEPPKIEDNLPPIDAPPKTEPPKAEPPKTEPPKATPAPEKSKAALPPPAATKPAEPVKAPVAKDLAPPKPPEPTSPIVPAAPPNLPPDMPDSPLLPATPLPAAEAPPSSKPAAPAPSAEPLPIPTPADTAPPVTTRMPKLASPPITDAAIIESQPATATDASISDRPKRAPLPDGVVPIPNLGKRRPIEPDEVEQPRAAHTVADAPLPREAPGGRAIDPILHTVEPNENFWTISKLYYNSGRYYKALHSANRKQVPNIRELYVGTVVKVPPIEDLDPSLIDAPSPASARSVSGTGRSSQDEPRPAAKKSRTNDEDTSPPSVGRGRSRERLADADEPVQPTYRVRSHDTLRSIARDTLGDARRYREILQLNRDLIDDPTHLTPGQVLTLPEDATVGRQASR